MMSSPIFIHSPALDEGGYPSQCPFNSHRAGLLQKKAESIGLLSDSQIVAPDALTREELQMYHEPAYLDAIRAAAEGNLTSEAFLMGIGTPDCPVFRNMYEYASLAAGGSTTGARLLVDKKARIVFNPSGGFHHAFPNKAAGFCYINDIVLAAMRMRKAGLRVALVDVDVHHCDGVQHAFYNSPDVLVTSMHEEGTTLFPGSGWVHEIGEGAGEGYTLNIPLPAGTGNAAYYKAFRTVMLPAVKAYAPDIIILEIGMDSLAGDPLAHLNLTNEIYVDILQQIMDLAVPILATGGGGYHIENTVRSWTLLWGVLCGRYQEDLSLGMGGVMLENTDWVGGLIDRTSPKTTLRPENIEQKIEQTIAQARSMVFPRLGIV